MLYRLSAFTDDPTGGNPAGVWLGDALPPDDEMQRIAAEVGYSETAFVAPVVPNDGSPRDDSSRSHVVRYYSPRAEVPFCGHATVATGVQLGRLFGDGVYRLVTRVGEVPVDVDTVGDRRRAALTSVDPRHEPAPDALLDATLAALGWSRDELEPSIAPARAFAGAWHLVLATRDAARLADLRYDFDALEALMRADDLTTLQLIWRESDEVVHSRNPFPVGGVVEDPATGAAAAALGGYLRDAGLLAAPVRFVIRQGEAMGRPSRLEVDVPAHGGIVVRGTAVPIETPSGP
ncbi:MAG: PhzF family phenazine biosynthesis isomerase [Acidobacteriota bacterium]